MEKFRYAPMSQYAQPIRLATLHPGDWDEQLHVELHDAHLPTQEDEPKSDVNGCEAGTYENAQVPEYTALSYVWGIENDPVRITVTQNTCTGVLRVTKNLTTALRNLRDRSQARVLWIDAICINQEDLQERSSQVAFMALVYKYAHPVLVWLGSGEDDGEFALEALNYWGSRVDVVARLADFAPKQDAPERDDRFTEPAAIQENMLSDRERQAVLKLISREWWRRLWVRQEVATREHVKVRCGHSSEFDFKTIMSGAVVATQAEYKLGIMGTLDLHPLRRLLNSIALATEDAASQYHFSALRYTLSQVRWREPVDAIYAVLDLIPEDQKALNIRPDYSRPAASILTEVAVGMLQVNQDATFLSSCELSSRSLPDLPSWVPDWSSQIGTMNIDSKWTSARISPYFHLEDGDTLTMAGICKGQVNLVKTVPPQLGHRIVAHILLTLPKDLSQPYIGGGDLCRAYAEAFVTGFIAERYSNDKYPPRATGERFLRVLHEVMDPALISHQADEYWGEQYNRYLKTVLNVHPGRSFISTKEGYIGLAPAATQPGDGLFVILGCDSPMILRPVMVPTTERDHHGPFTVLFELKWLVIGSCYTPGLMNGEALYGCKGEEQVTFELWNVDHGVPMEGLQDPETCRIRWNPKQMLEEVGIPVEALCSGFRVSVGIEALKAAGIKLELVRMV